MTVAVEMITREQWADIDRDIFTNYKLQALKKLRPLVGSLSVANKALHARYGVLRERHPEKFDCSAEEYWVGFYS